MTRYNETTKGKGTSFSLTKRADATENYEGALSFKPSNERLELFQRVVTCFFGEPKFYEKADDSYKILKEITERVAKEDPDFVLRLSIATRKLFNLRSVSMYLLCAVANVHPSHPLTYRAVAKVISRVDELTEIIAMNNALYPRKKRRGKLSLPQSIKKGVALAFNKFNEYQFAKYNRQTAIKLKDALILTHPKPKDEGKAKLFKGILEDTLKVPDTWEVVTSTKGSTTETWTEILPKMPIMAFVRNLRNLLQKDVDITDKIAKLKNPEIIMKSRMLPFRFYQAWIELNKLGSHKHKKKATDFLEYCVTQSVVNLPKWEGKTLVLVDLSGSMRQPVSQRSEFMCNGISSLFGALIHEMLGDKQAVIVPFASDFKALNLDRVPSVLKKANEIEKCGIYGGTYAHKPINHMTGLNYEFDRIVVLSDQEVWSMGGHRNSNTNTGRYGSYYRGTDTEFVRAMTNYRKVINPDVKLYMFDLAGYGHMVMPEDDRTILIGGWSDKIFSFIRHVELKEAVALDMVYNEHTEYVNYTH